MGLLDKLWDETLAGPTPDSGLGKLRKYDSFSPRSTAAPSPSVVPPPQGDVSQQVLPGSRSITVGQSIPRRSLSVSVDSPAVPDSPSGSSAPSSPFSPSTPGGNFKRLARRKSSSAAMANFESKSPKTPTGYDWIVLSALDR